MHGLRLAHEDLRAVAPEADSSRLDGVDYLLLSSGRPRAEFAAADRETIGRAVRGLGPRLYLDSQLRVLASLAGLEPAGAAPVVAAALADSGNAELPLAVTRGQNVLDRLEELLLHTELRNRDTGQRFAELNAKTVAAIVSLGPRATAQAAKQGARVVLTAHETPAVLAEAAAWVAFSRRNDPTARKLGKVLGECCPRLIAESLGRDGWAHDCVLQAELSAAGEVSFYGSAELCAAVQQRLAEPARERRRDQVDLSLIYVSGYAAEVCLRVANPAAGRRLADVLAKAPPIVRDCYAWDLESPFDERSPLVDLTLRHGSCERLAHAVETITGVIAVAAQELGVRWFGAPPQAAPVHAAWPTSLPVELLEWSVDIKPAHQWLD